MITHIDISEDGRKLATGDAAGGVVITDLTAAHGIASFRVACGGLAA